MVGETLRRKPGAPKGNKNALKYGYYSKIFSDKEQVKEFCSAADIQGIDEEIALMRHVIKSAARSRDDRYLSILVRATNSLNRLVRTRQKFYGKYDQLGEAIQNVVKDFLEPMGLAIGKAQINRINAENNQTINGGNEAEFTEDK